MKVILCVLALVAVIAGGINVGILTVAQQQSVATVKAEQLSSIN